MEQNLEDEQVTTGNRFQMLGGHPVLDFLNTIAPINGKSVDSLKTGRDVLDWIDRAGWPMMEDSRPALPPRLVKTARALRSEIRTLVENRKAGKRLDPKSLNAYLERSQSFLHLEPGPDRTLISLRNWEQRTAEQVLGPLTEAAAELLAEGDFRLVRRCENPECVLWFYDRTRSHHRRWCNMATCGNREKVAAFRDRRLRRSLSARS